PPMSASAAPAPRRAWQAPGLQAGSSASLRGVLERVHVLVAEAEVMPHLVHQHMRHEVFEALVAALDPLVEDGRAEQPDAVRHRARMVDRLLAQRDAFVDSG